MTRVLWKTWRACGAPLPTGGAHRIGVKTVNTGRRMRGPARHKANSSASGFPQPLARRNCR